MVLPAFALTTPEGEAIGDVKPPNGHTTCHATVAVAVLPALFTAVAVAAQRCHCGDLRRVAGHGAEAGGWRASDVDRGGVVGG